jgi:hypothetical protein
MASAAILAVVVAVGDGQGALATAMVNTAAEALSPVAKVELRELPVPSDDEALRIEDDLGARAVVKLVWMDTAHEEVRIRLHVARTGHWTERHINFAPADTLTERGRALGFAIASMLPEAAPELVPDTFGVAAEPEPLSRWGLTLAAALGGGVGGPAAGVGGALALEWFATRALSLRLIGGARDGSLSGQNLSGTDVAIFGGAGAAWWPIPPDIDHRFGLGVRADLLVLDHILSRDSTSGAEQHSAMLPGADLLLEASYLFGNSAEVVASAGAEVAFGTVEADVGATGNKAATVPPLRLVGALGVRLRF